MKKWITGAVLAILSTAGFAGFVDERKAVPAPASVPPVAAQPQAAAGQPGSVQSVQPVAAPAVVFEVLDSDKTLRETLSRWSAAAGWMHKPEHWALAEDYSVGGTAKADVFGQDFMSAVRVLISSTDLTSRPAQPCFYSNKVVRVIPVAGICDPAAK